MVIEARSIPVLSLMEWIRRYMMQAKREGLSQFDGLIMPCVMKMIQRMSELGTWYEGDNCGCV